MITEKSQSALKRMLKNHQDIIIAFIIVLVVGTLWSINYFSYIDVDHTERGTFGDMFGGVNALFSGLAFAGVIYAILLQRKELSLQRQELKMTRDEIKGQREQLESHSESFKLQSFENTFFEMLRLQSTVVNTVTVDAGGIITSGKEAIRINYNDFQRFYGRDVAEKATSVMSRLKS